VTSTVIPTWARAFAPASVGNVGVGFDVLGHALDGAGDRATVRRNESGVVRVVAVRGLVTDLPLESAKNTAGRALMSLLEHAPRGTGFDLELDKGIALGSGMGGSASSAVAALVAANATLARPVADDVLYECALDGEVVADRRHGRGGCPQSSAERLPAALLLDRPGRPRRFESPRQGGVAGRDEFPPLRHAEHLAGSGPDAPRVRPRHDGSGLIGHANPFANGAQYRTVGWIKSCPLPRKGGVDKRTRAANRC